MIVTMGLIGLAEVVVRQCLLGDIPIGCGKREGALGGGDGLIMPPAVEVECQKAGDLCQPVRVIEGFSQGLGLT